MKKILVSLFALMAVMTVQAQSICDSWCTMKPVVGPYGDADTGHDEYDESQYVAQIPMYTLNEDGTYSLADEISMSFGDSEFTVNYVIKGTYTLEGYKLTLTPDKNTINVVLQSVSNKDEEFSIPDECPCPDEFEVLINSYVDRHMTHFLEEHNMTVKINSDILEMNDGKQTLTFTRVSTNQN